MNPSLNNATLSALALSHSLKIPEDQSRELLAQALEHETWARFADLSNKNQVEKLDSELSPDIANDRLGRFANSLSELFELHPTTAKELARAINPFSINKPKPYRVEIKSEGGDSLNLKDLMDMAGGNEGMLDMIHKLAETSPELAKLKNITNLGDFQNSMRNSHPISPRDYYDALKNLTNWQLDDTFYEEEYTYLDESFHLVSPKDGTSYPVYLISLSAAPGDSNDDVFEEIKVEIAKYGSRALLLFRHPIHKDIKGSTFAVIGKFFDRNEWSWTLLTEVDPETQASIISFENFDLESPVLDSSMASSIQQGMPSHVAYQAIVSGHVDYEKGRLKMPKDIVTTTGVGGWCSYIF
jgi:hypothetical protein